MSTPTRFKNGVTTAMQTQAMGQYPLPIRSDVYEHFDDFYRYTAGEWTVTAGGAGSGVAITAGMGGLLTITTATSGVESIVEGALSNGFTPGYKTWFRTYVETDATVANPDYQIGLCTASATFNGNTDGVYFTKATAATAWSFVLRKASTSTTVALPTAGTGVPTGSTWYDMAYMYDGKGMFYIYFGNVLIGTYGTANDGSVGSLGSALTNLPASTTNLGITLLNGFHTATSALVVDFVHGACEVTR